MAIPSYQTLILDPNTDTFDNWLTVTNSMLESMSSVVITTGSDNNGDVRLNGGLTVSSMHVGSSLSGGTQQAPSNFFITSNTNFIGSEIVFSLNTSVTILGNLEVSGTQRNFDVATQNMTISSAQFIVNSPTVFSNSVVFESNTTFENISIAGTISSGESLAFTGNVSFQDINVSSTVTANNLVSESITANNITINSSANVTNLNVTGTSNNNILNATSLTVSGDSNLNTLTVSSNSSFSNITSSGTGAFVNLTSTNNLNANNISATNLDTSNLNVLGTGAVRLSRGTDEQRPASPISGLVRFNTQRSYFEGYDGVMWNRFGDNILQIAAQNGIIVRTSENSAVARSLASGSGISITNANGVDGNPTISTQFASNAELFSGSGTNKSIDAGNIYSAAAPVVVNTSLSTITLNFSSGRNFSFGLSGNRTLANPSNAQVGQSGIIIITQDAFGNRILTYGSSWKFPSGSSSLSTIANSIDVISYYVSSPTVILCTLLKRFV